MIFTAYFDESGTHGDSHALVVAAQLGTARQWELFERGLKRLRLMHGFDVFHAKDFRAKTGEFKGWSDQKRYAVITGITDLVKTTLTESVSVLLETERYLKEFKNAPRPNKMPIDSHFGVCFRNAISRVIRVVWDQGSNHRLNVIIEGGHKNVGAAISIFEELKAELENDFDDRVLGTITIAKKSDSLCLMAADFLAYIAFVSDREKRSGGPGPTSVARADIPQGETPWTHVRLAPHAFESRIGQFKEGQRRKALKRRISRKSED